LEAAIEERQPPPGLVHHSDWRVLGGFKWSSQHLDSVEELRWVRRSAAGPIERHDRGCVHRAVRRRLVVSIGRSSGRRSLEARPPRTRRWRRACPLLWERDGFATVDGWHRPSSAPYRVATCRSSNEKRSPFSGSRVLAFGRSHANWAAHRQRSRESCVGTPPRGVGTWSIGQRLRSGTQIVARRGRRSPSSRRTSN
jgi:hypothetical protein